MDTPVSRDERVRPAPRRDVLCYMRGEARALAGVCFSSHRCFKRLGRNGAPLGRFALFFCEELEDAAFSAAPPHSRPTAPRREAARARARSNMHCIGSMRPFGEEKGGLVAWNASRGVLGARRESAESSRDGSFAHEGRWTRPLAFFFWRPAEGGRGRRRTSRVVLDLAGGRRDRPRWGLRGG